MSRFETSVKTLASEFPRSCRIPHLENNIYIYGGDLVKIEPLPVYKRSKFSADDVFRKSKIEVETGLYRTFKPLTKKVHKRKEPCVGLNARGSVVCDQGRKSFDSLNTKATLSYKNQNEPYHKQFEVDSKSFSSSCSELNQKFEKPEDKSGKKSSLNKLKSDGLNENFRRLSKIELENSCGMEKTNTGCSSLGFDGSNKFEVESLGERNSLVRSGSIVKAKSENKGKVEEGGIGKNVVLSDRVNSAYPFLKQTSLKSEAISPKNSFFNSNLDKTEGKLTKSELQNMEVYTILRKNSKNSEANKEEPQLKNEKKSEASEGKLTKSELQNMEVYTILRKNSKNSEAIKEEPQLKNGKKSEASEGKLNSKSFDSERKLIQEKLIEDFKRENQRRELSRHNSLKFTGQNEPFSRKNSRKQTLKSKHSEQNEYSNRSQSSKQLSNKSFSYSDNEYSGPSNPTFPTTQKQSEASKAKPRQTPGPQLPNWFSYQNPRPKNFSLSTKPSDSNYHQSTFTYKVKYMENQSYTYSPGSKSFPKFQ